MNIYDINITNQDDTITTLNEYKGKVLLIVNTATHCGYTKQYKSLQTLYEKYHAEGLEILDFPCNQFAFQARGNAEDINSFCDINFKTTFKRFKKLKVNGSKQDDLFKYLKNHAQTNKGKRIKWNFTKFLISKDGTLIKRFDSSIDPLKIENEILHFLKI